MKIVFISRDCDVKTIKSIVTCVIVMYESQENVICDISLFFVFFLTL